MNRFIWLIDGTLIGTTITSHTPQIFRTGVWPEDANTFLREGGIHPVYSKPHRFCVLWMKIFSQKSKSKTSVEVTTKKNKNGILFCKGTTFKRNRLISSKSFLSMLTKRRESKERNWNTTNLKRQPNKEETWWYILVKDEAS